MKNEFDAVAEKMVDEIEAKEDREWDSDDVRFVAPFYDQVMVDGEWEEDQYSRDGSGELRALRLTYARPAVEPGFYRILDAKNRVVEYWIVSWVDNGPVVKRLTPEEWAREMAEDLAGQGEEHRETRNVAHVKVRDKGDEGTVFDIKYLRPFGTEYNPKFYTETPNTLTKELVRHMDALSGLVASVTGVDDCMVTDVVWKVNKIEFVRIAGQKENSYGVHKISTADIPVIKIQHNVQLLTISGCDFSEILDNLKAAALAMVDADIRVQAKQMDLFGTTSFGAHVTVEKTELRETAKA